MALDPEASGPDTHYKVLQATTEALRIYEKESGRSDLQILGYRNVWYRFHPGDLSLLGSEFRGDAEVFVDEVGFDEIFRTDGCRPFDGCEA